MNYEKVYGAIVDRARNRVLEGYGEVHHIVPRCRGGSDDPVNLVKLTVREHFLCHWLLCRIYPKDGKLGYAFWFMSRQKAPGQQRDYIVSSRTYAEAVSCIKRSKEAIEKTRLTRVGKKTVVHPITQELKYVNPAELDYWRLQGWENTNRKKGKIGQISEEGRKKLAEHRRKHQTGKTGLDAQAAKGPYTVTFETGETFTAGSYPELAKMVRIHYSTLQYRYVNNPGTFKKGWKIK